MSRLTEFLGSHWLTVALLVAAAVAGVRVARRRLAGRGTPPGAVAVVFACGLLGLGAVFLTKWPVTLFEYKLTVAEILLLVAGFGFVLAGLVLAFTRGWSFWVGV